MLSQADTGDGVLSDSKVYPFHQNIVFASYSLFEYLTKCLIPIKLSYIYPFPNVIGEPLLARFLIYPFVLIVLAITFWNFLKQRWVFFGLSFFIIHLAVALHIIPLSRFAIIADRYVYVSAIGIFFTMAWLLEQAIIKNVKGLSIVLSFSFLYVVILGIYAHQHAKVWHNSDTLKSELKELLEQRNDYLHKDKPKNDTK